MKKILGYALIVLILVGLCVSCSSDVEEEVPYGTCTADFSVNGGKKNLGVSVDMNLVSSGTDAFYWRYKATKMDSYGKEGQKTSLTPFKASGTGLAKLENLSTGKWTFEIVAYLDQSYTKQVYDGKLENVVLSANADNIIEIAVQRCKVSGQNGKLHIDPKKINIAIDSGSVIVMGEDRLREDELADQRLFGKLSDYSYTVYNCDKNWNELTTLTSYNNKEELNTTTSDAYVVDVDLAPGTYYIKFRLSMDAGDANGAVCYIAMVEVDVYSNCITEIADGMGVEAGITVKRVKEYKVYYYDTSTSNFVPFSGIHMPIPDEDEEGNVIYTTYPKTHKYGVTEMLDEPTKENHGFAGYYDTATPTSLDFPLKAIPAYQAEDVYLYAKWASINYKTITWNDNWPKPAVARSTNVVHSPDGAGSGSIGDVIAAPSTNPICVGYKFLGWYGDDVNRRFSGYVPDPTKSDEVLDAKAFWEPIKYKIKFNVNKGNDGVEAGSFACTNTNVYIPDAEYDLQERVYDCESLEKGFLGWSTYSNWDTGANHLLGLDGYVVNLTEIDNAEVTLYAIWSDYFIPLEYIRSYPATSVAGPYIDTKVNNSSVTTMKARIEMAGNSVSYASGEGMEMPFGAYNPGSGGEHSFGINIWHDAVSYERKDVWAMWGNDTAAVGGSGGLWFHDDIYDLELYQGSTSRYLNVDGERIVSFDRPWKAVSNNIYLFANNNGIADWHTDMRLYSCQMFDSAGSVVRKFVPCRLCKDVPATYSSDGTAHNGGTAMAGEIGLWDLRTNQFYPNKDTSVDSRTGEAYRFYQPSDEVKVTFHANNGNPEHKDRVQKILNNKTEKLHVCVFSKDGSTFQGWMEEPASSSWIGDKYPVTLSANKEYWAKWSAVVSWALFGQKDWVRSDSDSVNDSTGGAVVDTGYYVDSNFHMECGFQRLGKTGPKGGNLATNFLMGTKGTTSGGVTECKFGISIFNGNVQASVLSIDWYIFEGENDNYHDIVVDGPSKSFTYDGVSTGEWNKAYNRGTDVTDSTITIFGYNCYGSVVQWGRFKVFYVRFKVGDTIVNDLVPAVLTADLTSASSVVCGDGTTTTGNLKVFGNLDCHKGDAGFWDLITDKFYPKSQGGGKLFVDEESFLIRYDANSGLGVMEDQKIVATATDRLFENRFKRDGYEFIGWADLPDGNDTDAKWYSDSRVMHPEDLRNMTLFAQWRPVSAMTSKYVELPWLECSDASGKRTADSSLSQKRAFINTNFNGTGKGRVVYRFMTPYALPTTVFGNGGGASASLGVIYNNRFYFAGGTKYDGIGELVGTIHTADVQYYNGKLAFRLTPGIEKTGEALTYTPNTTTPYCIFGRYYNATSAVSDEYGSRFYYVKIYDSKDKLVRDYIPVMLVEDLDSVYDSQRVLRKKGTLGMWDKCEDKFYANAGPGYLFCDDVVNIVFNPNGGSGSMDNLTFLESEEFVSLSKNIFTNGSKVFIGWNTKADGSGIWYHDEYKTNEWEGGVMNLFAQWEETAGSIDTCYFEPVNYVIKARSALMNYIDVKYYPNADTKVDISFYLDWWSRYAEPFGSRTASHSNDSFVICRVGNNQIRAEAGNKNYMLDNSFGLGNHVISMTHTQLIIDGKAPRTTTWTPVDNNWSLYLFALNDGGNYTSYDAHMIAMRVSNFKISEGTTVVKNFVPCRLVKKISSYVAGRIAADQSVHKVGEVGFWDLVENKFYGTATSDEFVCELSD